VNSTYDWYQQLTKPSWSPPSWLFGPVWSMLYIIIAITFGIVVFKAFKGKLPWMVALPFILNLIFNFAFSPLQFWLKSNILAAVDIVLVLGTLIWAMVAVYRLMPWVSLANIPYLLWVVFATALQLTITCLNRK
jgi:tryptophan-rich sensory protein